MFSMSIWLIVYAGIVHAFEADHLLAVSNIVTQRNSILHSMKDGICWGLGHTSIILIMGVIMIVCKVQIRPHYFHYFEALVGIMLVVIGVYRLYKLIKHFTITQQPTASFDQMNPSKNLHKASYGIGLMHGLAGSGELVLLVMIQIISPTIGLLYLLLFSVGTILGMLVAAALCSIPFSKKMLQANLLKIVLTTISSLLCIIFGANIFIKNMAA
jgi:high-affinity nickel permease